MSKPLPALLAKPGQQACETAQIPCWWIIIESVKAPGLGSVVTQVRLIVVSGYFMFSQKWITNVQFFMEGNWYLQFLHSFRNYLYFFHLFFPAIFPHELDGRQNDLRLHFTKVMHRFLLFSFHFDAFFPPARCFAKFQRSFSLKPLELSHDGSTWTDSELLFSQERAIQKIILK